MNWLAWRQHRVQFMIAGIFLVLSAAFMIPMGANFWHTYQQALSTCKGTETCSQLSGDLFQSHTDQLLLHLVKVIIIIIPIILGLFWGVPFLAKEYGDGTNKLVWTQGVSRKKWLTVQLAWVLAGAAIVAAGFVALSDWYFRTDSNLNMDRFQTLQFSSEGIMLIGFAVFAVSLGAFLGAWLKKTTAAMGTTLFLLIVVGLVVMPNYVRPYLMTPRTTTAWTNQIGPGTESVEVPNGALVTSYKIVNKQGQMLSWSNPPKNCIIPQSELPGIKGNAIGTRTSIKAPGNGGGSIMSVNGGPAISGSCLENDGYHYAISYQPAYRYWDFQLIETGLYLALSIIPLAGTYWLVLKRDA